MKIKLLIVLLCFSSLMVRAQQRYADSLKQVLQFAKNDSSKLNTLNLLSYYYNNLYPDSGIYYADKMIELADQAKDNYGKVEGLFHKSDAYQHQAKNSEALKMAYNALEIAEKLKESRSLMMAKAYSKISRLNGLAGKDSIATASIQKALGFITQTNYKPEDIINIYLLLGSRHGFRQGIDSAFYYAKKAYELFLHLKEKRMFAGLPFVTLASKYFDRGKFYEDKKDTVNALKNFDSTFIYMEAGIKFCREINAIWWVGTLYQFNILYCYNTDRQDSSLYYARQLLDTCTKYHYLPQMEMVNGFFSQWYQHNSPNKDSAIKYLQAVLDTKVRIANEQNISKFGEISFNEIQRQKDLQEQKKEFQTRLKIYGLLGIILIVLLITFFIYRGYRTKQRDIKLLQVQKKETETQKIIAEDALENLKSTQAQLVQSEKMASLGELTAGIAHEIQNPLNFVNNFSDVNKELLTELSEEIDKGNYVDVKAIAKDVIDNEEKINHHGKRADAIVKGMLQHSRSSSGKKEPTDINALADEYLRLSYHGLRAKDKSFNATMKTDFDDSIGKINIIPQDIGRVLLNLYNNAFYACAERSRSEKELLGVERYVPTVTLVAKKLGDKIAIAVKDNGNGIPQKIVDKIFQPFFTTKPTGQGTGLGLSLSYDIIKAHGGEIKVETKEGEGSTFIIQLAG